MDIITTELDEDDVLEEIESEVITLAIIVSHYS